MLPGDLDEKLRDSADDFRLSRSERRRVADWVREASDHELALLLNRAFTVARGLTVDPETAGVIEWLEDVVQATRAADQAGATASPEPEALFSPEDNCAGRIASLFYEARESVDVCVFTITDDRITSAIVEAHRRGTRIRILTDDLKSLDTGSDIARLSAVGIPVRVDRSEYHMHHKYAVFDGQTVLTGSYNWTRSASRFNEENLIVVHDPRLTRRFASQFESLWNRLN